MTATGMWVEKYRPMKLSEVVNQTEIIGSLEALIKDPTDMPHLLFSGAPGVGKGRQRVAGAASAPHPRCLGEAVRGSICVRCWWV